MNSSSANFKQLCLTTAFLLLSPWGLNADFVEGVIEEIDQKTGSIVLKTGAPDQPILRLTLGRGDSQIYVSGDSIRGETSRVGGALRLQTVWPNASVIRGTLATFEQRLRQDTKIRGSRAFRSVGEYMPKFALIDQQGKLFISESLKGKYVILNFIFTRCANAKMCPAATARMIELQEKAKAEGIDDLHLVSVTLDPEYDTPGIFKTYEMDKGIDPQNFSLLGGSEAIVEDLKIQLGILAEKDPDEIIKHTLTTTLIDPNGKIIYRIPGSLWDPQIFLKQIKKDKEI